MRTSSGTAAIFVIIGIIVEKCKNNKKKKPPNNKKKKPPAVFYTAQGDVVWSVASSWFCCSLLPSTGFLTTSTNHVAHTALSVFACLCVFPLGQVCDSGHPSRSEYEDAFQPRASAAEEPADQPCPHGLRHQVHGLLQRELLEEKGYAGRGKQERGKALPDLYTLSLILCHQVTVALWWLRRKALPLAWHWMTQSLMGVNLPLWGECKLPDTDDHLP